MSDQGRAVDRPIPAPQGQFHGSNRKLITESPSQGSESSGRIPSNTSAASQLPQSADQGQGRTSEGQNWEATKARAESKVAQVEDSASRGVDKLKESVKSASGMSSVAMHSSDLIISSRKIANVGPVLSVYISVSELVGSQCLTVHIIADPVVFAIRSCWHQTANKCLFIVDGCICSAKAVDAIARISYAAAVIAHTLLWCIMQVTSPAALM